MYYIVYLLKPKKNVVIPMPWVSEGKKHLEKFVNNAINCNQIYLCYYSQEDHALLDEQPNPDFVPDFRSSMNIDFPNTGCYYEKLVQFKGIFVVFFFKFNSYFSANLTFNIFNI